MKYLSIAMTIIPAVLSLDYLPEYIPYSPCQNVYGGDWILVRHASLLDGNWHPAKDKLEGTQVYGGFGGSSPTTWPNDPSYASDYSIPFDELIADPTIILFSDTKCDKYIVTTFADIRCDAHGTAPYLADNVLETSSSSQTMEWHSRCGDVHDPLISMTQPWTANDCEGVMYAGNNWNGCGNKRSEMANSNVWIKVKGISNTLGKGSSIFTPNLMPYVQIPQYLFYFIIICTFILFIILSVCLLKARSASKTVRYQKVNMNSSTDIEN